MKTLVTITLLASFAQGQIAAHRVREIQRALNGHGQHVQVTGAMDSRTVDALKEFQREHGWQHKVVPDARALQKLGLGPVYSGLLNPETAAIPEGSTVKEQWQVQCYRCLRFSKLRPTP